MKKILLTLCCFTLLGCQSNDKELHVYTFEGYFQGDIIHRFEQQHHCRVVLDTFDSNEAMFAKLRLGAKGYDVVVASSYFVPPMIHLNLLKEIDYAQLPNTQYLDPKILRKLPGAIRPYAIPYFITFSMIAYRKDRVHEIEDSWNMFGRSDLRGRMTMLNDMRDALGAALKYRGYSINTTNPAQVHEAASQLLKWKKNLAKFENEQYKNGLSSAEFLVVQAYSSDTFQLMQDDPEIAPIIPREGVILACDELVIPNSSLEPELAIAFINFLHEPENAAQNMTAIGALCPNTRALDLLTPEQRNNPVLYPPPEIAEKSEFIHDLGPQIVIFNRAWERVKDTEE